MGEDDLTQIEIDVLNALSRGTTTPSAVRLAAEVWQQGGAFDTGDPVGLVTFVLEGLNERGLVSFRVDDPKAGRVTRVVPGYDNLPHTIRLTHEGWVECGFPILARQVGLGWGRGFKTHDGDRTDFRRHAESAEGGTIVREDAYDHIAANPTHDHSFITGEDMGDTDMTRPYTRVTPDMLANVLEARTRLGPLASYREIAEETGESPRTVRYLLTTAPLLRRLDNGEAEVAASLKDRIVKALEMLGPMKDAGELRAILSHGDSDHDIVHVLHSLHKQGVVDFTEGRDKGEPKSISLRKKGNGKAKIVATDPAMERGLKGEPMTEEVAEVLAAFVTDRIPEGMPGGGTPLDQATVEALANPVTVAQVDEATVPKPDFPMLRDLIEREAKRLTKDKSAMAYVTAAEALIGIDDAMYADLIAKAEANDVPFPSPIEQEYLKYSQTYPNEGEPTDV